MKQLLKELNLQGEQFEKILQKYEEKREEWQKKLDDKDIELQKINKAVLQLEEAKNSAKDWEIKYNNDILNLKKNYAVDMAIIKEKGRNTKAIKALIDMENLKLNDDGSLEGFNIDEIKKNEPYLFNSNKIEGAGNSGIKAQFENALFN